MIKEFIDMPGLEGFIGKTFRFLSPNTWTTMSLLLAIIAFVLVIKGLILAGICLFVLSTFCDLIDGKVARYTQHATKLGAFWDGVVDRFVDALLILCFFFLEFPRSDFHISLVLYILLFMTLMPPFIVAYANHRGAVPDPSEKVIWRFAFRIEYLLIFFLAIFMNPLSPRWSYYLLLGALVLMTATVLQSIFLVFIKSRLYRNS
jgi:archaetidylinositol phosphate synthase